MKFSWLIVFISIVAWSWFNQQGLIGTLLSLLIALALFLPWRWDITLKQFHRIGDLSSVLIVLVLAYGVFAQTERKTVFIILQWLPLCFTPMLFAQLLSIPGRVPLGILFYSVRNRPPESVTWLDFKTPFAGITLLSTGAGNDQTGFYFLVVIAILIMVLWAVRPRQSSIILWFISISFAATIAFKGQQELRVLHSLVEEKAVDWFSDWRTDPFKSHTSIGDIGDLKLSDKIAYRIQASEPMLLLQASYDRFMGQSWYASKRVFKELTWDNESSVQRLKQMSISQLSKRESILALPAGTSAIDGLEGALLQSNELGAVKLSEAPDFIKFKVHYSGKQPGAVGRYDLDVPERHRDWVTLLKQQLSVEGLPTKMIAKKIESYFHNHFYYTLFLGETNNADQALREFILNRKAGHCEYFAVATVFLLRSYGIPARLANGYAMQEYDASERMFIVRKRHAHAWAIAHIDGYWQPVDSTPSQWLAIEEENADPLQPLYDWFSSLQFSYRQWRYQQAQTGHKDDESAWIGVVLLLVGYLLWRLYAARRQMIKPRDLIEEAAITHQRHGLDSEFYQIEKALKNTDKARVQNEPVEAWVKRIKDPGLIAIAQIHYRYRFDPESVTEQQRQALRQDVRIWLDHFSTLEKFADIT